MGDIEKMDELKEALESALEKGDRGAEAAALYGIGGMYFKDEVFEAAEDYWSRCEAVCRDTGRDKELIQVVSDLGDLSQAVGDLDRARERYQEALDLSVRTGVVQGEARLLERLGSLEFAADRMDVALEFFKRGLDLCRRHEDQIGRLFFIDQAIPILKAKGLAAEVEEAYREYVTGAEKAGDRERMAIGLVGLADVYERTGRPDEAIPYLELAHDVFLRLKREKEAALIKDKLSVLSGGSG